MGSQRLDVLDQSRRGVYRTYLRLKLDQALRCNTRAQACLLYTSVREHLGIQSVPGLHVGYEGLHVITLRIILSMQAATSQRQRQEQ